MQTRPMTRIMGISGYSFIHSFVSRDPACSPWEQLRWDRKYGERQPEWDHFQIKYVKTQWVTQRVSQSQSSVGAKADSSCHCFLGHPQPPTTIGYCSGRVLSALTRTIFFFLWKLCFDKTSCLLWPDRIPRKRWRLSTSVLSCRAKREKSRNIHGGQKEQLRTMVLQEHRC